MTSPHPVELRFQKAAKNLHIVFDTGEARDIPYELLRVASPSAEVQGHGGAKPLPLLNKQEIGVLSASPVGHYAVRIKFDDGHDSGLFTWSYLRELSEDPAARLAAHHAAKA